MNAFDGGGGGAILESIFPKQKDANNRSIFFWRSISPKNQYYYTDSDNCKSDIN